MARGVRKSPMEKLQDQLSEVQESIRQYENCLVTLKEKEKTLNEQIELEELKAIHDLMTKQGIGIKELKRILESNVTAVEEEEEFEFDARSPFMRNSCS